jgi:hypothetical protein
MSSTSPTRTTWLLFGGLMAGPVYLLLGFGQAMTRGGFDVRLHALSQLSNGALGWIQVTNFFVTGALVLAGAVGVRRALHPGRAGTWGPILLGTYAVGMIGAGFFDADPGRGFPPGTPEVTTMSQAGLLHFVFGGVGFYAAIAACFVFARRFLGLRRMAWCGYSLSTGILFFVAFAAIASGSTSSIVMLAFYGAVTWLWIWHTAVLWDLITEVRHGH